MRHYDVLATSAFGLALTLASAIPANAAILTVFDGIPQGTADFISTVNAAGAVAASDNWSGLVSGATITRPATATSPNAYTVTKPGGDTLFPTTYGSMTGQVVDISPSGSGTDPTGYRNSGIELNFSAPINSFGFEVGDWGTCCTPSRLFISFDNGAPIQVGVSNGGGDVIFNGAYEVFVAAFDDSGTFSTVQFWGDGIGEYLVAGGTIRYATLDEGSLVPEPTSVILLGAGLAGLLARRRRS